MKITFGGKIVEKCYQTCPHFGLDGGPSPTMVCNHPKAPYGGHIISHPECDAGFPKLCPLINPREPFSTELDQNMGMVPARHTAGPNACGQNAIKVSTFLLRLDQARTVDLLHMDNTAYVEGENLKCDHCGEYIQLIKQRGETVAES